MLEVYGLFKMNRWSESCFASMGEALESDHGGDWPLPYKYRENGIIFPVGSTKEQVRAILNASGRLDHATDPINPTHYKANGMEAIDVMEAFGLTSNYYRSSALKYVLRAGKKGDDKEDLQKAIWFLQREIDKLMKEKA